MVAALCPLLGIVFCLWYRTGCRCCQPYVPAFTPLVSLIWRKNAFNLSHNDGALGSGSPVLGLRSAPVGL